MKEDSDLMIITKNGKIIRIESGEIRQAGRSTQGVRLVSMEEGDQVAAASRDSRSRGISRQRHGDAAAAVNYMGGGGLHALPCRH